MKENPGQTAGAGISPPGNRGASDVPGIYGDEYRNLEAALQTLLDRVETLRKSFGDYDSDPVEHCLGRIKSEESMREKCRRQGLPETPESALRLIHDAIGLRIVCAFVNDVYMMRDYILNFEDIELIHEKDYIRHAKPNGYRSLHLIVRVNGKYYAEIQLRTISMDTWAALEHHLRYKKKVSGNTELLENELKRCADELASTDLSMQTLRDMIKQ